MYYGPLTGEEIREVKTGARIGPYETVAKVGEGGMGEVSGATDTKLKRQIAIKILPAAVAGDAERLAHFRREAEVLSSLNQARASCTPRARSGAQMFFPPPAAS